MLPRATGFHRAAAEQQSDLRQMIAAGQELPYSTDFFDSSFSMNIQPLPSPAPSQVHKPQQQQSEVQQQEQQHDEHPPPFPIGATLDNGNLTLIDLVGQGMYILVLYFFSLATH